MDDPIAMIQVAIAAVIFSSFALVLAYVFENNNENR